MRKLPLSNCYYYKNSTCLFCKRFFIPKDDGIPRIVYARHPKNINGECEMYLPLTN